MILDARLNRTSYSRWGWLRLYPHWFNGNYCRVKMSYCPECCSEDVDGVLRGNKRYYVCSICGAEWAEVDNYGNGNAEQESRHHCPESIMPSQTIKRFKQF